MTAGQDITIRMQEKSMGQTAGKWRAVIEYGPLLLFFLVNFGAGRLGLDKVVWATSALILATVIALAASWQLERRIPRITLFGGIAVALFGGLTIAFDDPIFIKLKPTIISGLIAVVLVAGQLLGRNPLKAMLDGQMQLSDEGWRLFGWLWAVMFTVQALANEVARRLLSFDGWVSFKVFGLLGISLLFAVLSVPVIHRHTLDNPQEGAGSGDRQG